MVAKFTFFQLLSQNMKTKKRMFCQNDPRWKWENNVNQQGKRNG